MMINTAQFGQVEIEEEEIYTFCQGIPGFEEYRYFILIRPDADLPFSYLQSTEAEEISLLITDPFVFYRDYDFQLAENAQEELDIQEGTDMAVWCTVSIKEQMNEATLNLLAPIIMNLRNKQMKQVILHDTSYKTRHPLIRATSQNQPVEE